MGATGLDQTYRLPTRPVNGFVTQDKTMEIGTGVEVQGLTGGGGAVTARGQAAACLAWANTSSCSLLTAFLALGPVARSHQAGPSAYCGARATRCETWWPYSSHGVQSARPILSRSLFSTSCNSAGMQPVQLLPSKYR